MAASRAGLQSQGMPRAVSYIAWVLWLLVALCTSLAIGVDRPDRAIPLREDAASSAAHSTGDSGSPGSAPGQ